MKFAAQVIIVLVGLCAIIDPVRSDAQENGNASASRAEDSAGQPAEDSGFREFDGFDEKLALDWKPLRHDPTHCSLTTNAGKLTITTQFGSMHQRKIPEANSKNVFLIDNPQPQRSGFVVTTRLDSFQPEAPWHQAGLILFDDEDNYLKFVLEFNNRTGHAAGVGPVWNLLREVDAVSSITKTLIEGDLPDPVWLRLTVRGSRHEYATSLDGEEFTVHGELPWGDGSPEKIGLLATNGGTTRGAEIDACFDLFELRSLTADEKNDPRWVERQKLAGTWQAVASEVGGKASEDGLFSQFLFTDTTVTVKEKGGDLKTDFSVDPTKRPKQLTLSTFSAPSGSQLKAIYAFEGDTLKICLNLLSEGEAPSGFETKEGDGRLLVTLKRVQQDN